MVYILTELVFAPWHSYTLLLVGSNTSEGAAGSDPLLGQMEQQPQKGTAAQSTGKFVPKHDCRMLELHQALFVYFMKVSQLSTLVQKPYSNCYINYK